MLDEVKSIAIVGVSSNPERDSYKVMKFLQDYGFEVFPVNPNLINTKILNLQDLTTRLSKNPSIVLKNTLKTIL